MTQTVAITPRFLNKTQAAAYLGVSLPTFDIEIRNGLWPQPMRRGAKETSLTWDKVMLDAAADRLAGAHHVTPAAENELAAAERAALEASKRGTAKAIRPQHRHSKAA